MADYSYTSLHDGRQEAEQYTGTAQTGFEAYRALTYRPNAVAGLYGQLLKQTLPQWQNAEFDVTGWGADLAPAFYFHGDYQNSTIKVTGLDATAQYRYGYTPMGQAYSFKHRYSDEQMTRSFSSHSPNRNVVQNLYTGKYAEPLTGLANMDARWYDAQQGRFIQGDQHNHANLMLPAGAQSELMRYIGRSQSDLLRDPAQQMRYGYVSGNALRWVDPVGLCEMLQTENVQPEDIREEFYKNELLNLNVTKTFNDFNYETFRPTYNYELSGTVSVLIQSNSQKFDVHSEVIMKGLNHVNTSGENWDGNTYSVSINFSQTDNASSADLTIFETYDGYI